MPNLAPIYTAANCNAAYQLNWSLAVFWASSPPPESAWLDELRAATEADSVRILEHYSPRERVSQFLISTRPETAPPAAVRSIKGRLQHLVRKRLPKAFHRNYGLRSLGSVNCDTVRQYIESQTSSSHARYCYNLHVVFVSSRRDVEIRAQVLDQRRRMVVAAAEKKGHLLGNGQVLAEHIHFAVGCNLEESPGEVAISYLNNLAFTEGMRPVYEFVFYVGTFGEYDLGAVWQHQ
ncbi:MAG TPA: transposase [Pirellulales bacterium]